MDINELKNRLANLNRRTNKPNDIWKPKDEHVVRLLPYPHGDDPFLELHFHYEIGDNPSILCPKANFGDECEICDFCDLLKSWKTPDGDDKKESDRKADWELFKKIQPKARVFVPMVERGKEGDGAKFWGVTPNQAAEILKVALDGDRLAELDISPDDTKNALNVIISPAKAYDLTVQFAKPGEKGNTKSFAQVTITGKIKPTPLAKEKKATDDILASIKPITEVYPKVSSAEVSKLFKKFVGSGGSEAKAEGGVEYNKKSEKPAESAPAATNSKENAKMAGTRSIDEAFGEMLAEEN